MKKADFKYGEMVELGRLRDNVESQALQVEGKMTIKEENVYRVNQIKSENNRPKNARNCYGSAA